MTGFKRQQMNVLKEHNRRRHIVKIFARSFISTLDTLIVSSIITGEISVGIAIAGTRINFSLVVVQRVTTGGLPGPPFFLC